VERPPEMLRGSKPEIDPEFAPAEALYRRVDPEDIDEYQPGKLRVITTAWPLHNISVVRSKYARPDHARWDSATDPGNPPGFEPKLWRDWYVIQVLVEEIPPTLTSPGGVAYQFAVAHVPFDDLYAHSEVRASKDGTLIVKQNKFKSDEVKAQYRGVLTNKAKVILKPFEIEPAPAQGRRRRHNGRPRAT
jgi:hypothetical protein